MRDRGRREQNKTVRRRRRRALVVLVYFGRSSDFHLGLTAALPCELLQMMSVCVLLVIILSSIQQKHTDKLFVQATHPYAITTSAASDSQKHILPLLTCICSARATGVPGLYRALTVLSGLGKHCGLTYNNYVSYVTSVR